MGTQQRTREQRHSSEQHSGEQRFGERCRFSYKRASLSLLAALLAFGCLSLSACAKNGPSEKELAEQRAAESYEKIAEAKKQKQEEIDKNNADDQKPILPWAIPRSRENDEIIPKSKQINEPPPDSFYGYNEFSLENSTSTVAYFYDSLYYAFKTGELKYYDSVISSQCEQCARLRKSVENYRATGRKVEAAYPEYNWINYAYGTGKDQGKIQVNVDVTLYPVYLTFTDNQLLGKIAGGADHIAAIVTMENGHNVVLAIGKQ